MKDLMKAIGKDLYERIWVARKSTLLGIVLGGAIETGNMVLLPYLNTAPSPWLHTLAGIVTVLLMSLKAKVPPVEPKPQGFVRWELLALLSVLLLAGACATFRGARVTTTVYTEDGKSYSLDVGDAGGCVVGSGWYAIPKTPFECSKVCVDVNPGAVTPGAVCRLVGRPETEFQVEIPIPTKGS